MSRDDDDDDDVDVRVCPILDGRLPHRQIRDILESAYRAKTRKDLMAISKQINFVARRFEQIVGEFVASYARAEEKKRDCRIRPDMKGIYLRCLLFDRFYRIVGMNARTCYNIHTFIGKNMFSSQLRPRDWDPLRIFVESRPRDLRRWEHILFEKDRHNDVLHAIVEDRCDILREMIDEKRLDMRDNIVCICGTQACAPDGISRFCKVAIEQIVWFNQNILAGRDGSDSSRVNSFVRKRFFEYVRHKVGYTDDSTSWQCNRADLNMAAKASGTKPPSLADTRAFVYDHSFPRLVRALHVTLYNECRLHGAPWHVVVDPRAVALLNIGKDYTDGRGRILDGECRLGYYVILCIRSAVLEIVRSPSGQLRETLKARRRHGETVSRFNWGEPLKWYDGGPPKYRDAAADRARWDALRTGPFRGWTGDDTRATTKKKKKKKHRGKERSRRRGRHH